MASSIKSSDQNKSQLDQEDILHSLQRPLRYYDSYITLSQDRSIFLGEDFTKQVAAEMTAWLLHYDRVDAKKPIKLFISTDGGDGAALTNIYDVMHMISAPVHTICVGKCYSAGAFILAAGTKGHRYIYPHGQVMIHGLQCVVLENDQNNSKTYLKFLNDYNDRILGLLAKHTKQTLEKIKEDCKRDLYFDAQEAVSYGIVDWVLT